RYGRGLAYGLQFAFHNPFVVGHLDAIHLKIDHVDGFVGGTINGGFSPINAGHMVRIQDDRISYRIAASSVFLDRSACWPAVRSVILGTGIGSRVSGRASAEVGVDSGTASSSPVPAHARATYLVAHNLCFCWVGRKP